MNSMARRLTCEGLSEVHRMSPEPRTWAHGRVLVRFVTGEWGEDERGSV